MDPLVYQIAFYFVLFFPFYMMAKGFWNSRVIKYSQNNIEEKNILYVIAHPDDEAMFFTPSIVELR